MELKKEYAFTLPKGMLDKEGNIHKNGRMRLATAKDEINAMNHPLARKMNEYVTITLLAQVILDIDGIECITPEVIEKMYTADVNFLQNLYQTINHDEEAYIHVQCPHCSKEFNEPLNFTHKE